MSFSSEALKVVCEEDCGNAPKKRLLKEWLIAFARKDFRFCSEWMTEDAVWHLVGDRMLHGRGEIVKAWEPITAQPILELNIHHIITHGNAASADGMLVCADGTQLAFCHVFAFAGFGPKAKIKSIASYIIRV